MTGAPKSEVTALEVAEHLCRVVRGEMTVVAEGSRPYNGDLAFQLGDWRVEFTYYDGHLDRCELVDAPGKREANSDDWQVSEDDDGNPVYLLSSESIRALERILERAISRFERNRVTGTPDSAE